MKYGDLILRCNPSQSEWELNELLLIVERVGPVRAVLEIGSHRGGSARVWRDALRPQRLVAVNWSDEFVGDMTDICPVVGARSQDETTYERTKRALGQCPLDFLFIDGGHSYSEVAQDWALYVPLVAEGGVIALHDVCAPESAQVQVGAFWREIRQIENTVTLLEAGRTGIGVLFR